jgi:hypothetical protein
MELLYPLLFNETINEDKLSEYECSDGIYVSNDRFRLFMSDGEELIVIAIKRGLRRVNTFIRGTHNDANDFVYAPSWICQLLGDGEGFTVELERTFPSIGSSITIKPEVSAYSLLEDPVTELRNAFENYCCIGAGIDIPLLVDGVQLVVSIIDVGNEGPICIRGIELEVKIETPLDKQAEQEQEELAEMEALEAKAQEESNRFLQEELDEKAKLLAERDKKRFPGVGRRLDGKNIN